jgi:hypothetical protein
MCAHTLLIYDNKSLASHNECDFVQHFLLNQPIHEKSFLYLIGSQMRGPRDAIVVRRRVAQLPFFRFTSASSSFIGIYFRFLILYWYLLPFPHLLFVSVYLLVVSVYLLVVSVYLLVVSVYDIDVFAHNINV